MDVRAKDAEVSVIGGMLLDEIAAASALEQLSENDFSDPACQQVFAAALRLASEGKRIDAVTLIPGLGNEFKTFLLDAALKLPSLSGYQHYIDVVLEESKRRKLLNVISEQQLALIEGCPVMEAEQAIYNVLNETAKSDGELCTAYEAMSETIDELEGIRKTGKQIGITTGFSSVDYKIGTFLPGGYYIIGARSGMGKTALLLCMVRAAAKSGKRCLVFSLEMPRKGQGGLSTRLLSQETQIEHDKIRFAKYSDRDLKLMRQQTAEDYMNNIIIYDKAEMTVMQIQSVIRRVKPDIVYIDYLGLIKAKKADKREIEIATVSRELRNVAKALKVPMVVLVQLNRETDTAKAKDKAGRPTLANISESDSIHRDADTVMLLYRPAQYNSKEDEHKAELIVAKNRQGKTGIVPLFWTGETMTFNGMYEFDQFPVTPPDPPKLKEDYDDVELI